MVSSALVKMSNKKRILHGTFKTLKIRLLHLTTVMLQSCGGTMAHSRRTETSKQLWSNLSFILALVPRVTEVCHRRTSVRMAGFLAEIQT
jgi:hypothetical protein